MNNIPTDKDFQQITQQSYNKLSNSIKKGGYADGISDGRDSTFQRDFDIGYESGLKNAFVLGKYHGVFAALKLQESNTSADTDNLLKGNDDTILKQPSRGQCQICVNKSLINHNLDEILSFQCSHSTNICAQLQLRYKDVHK